MYQVTYFNDWSGEIDGVVHAKSFDAGAALALKEFACPHQMKVDVANTNGTFSLRVRDGNDKLVTVANVPLAEPAAPEVIDACNALAQGDAYRIKALFQKAMGPDADSNDVDLVNRLADANQEPSNAAPSCEGSMYQVALYNQGDICNVVPAESFDDAVAHALKNVGNLCQVTLEVAKNEEGTFSLNVSEGNERLARICSQPLAEPASTDVIDACNALAQGDNSLIKALFAPAPSRAARPRP